MSWFVLENDLFKHKRVWTCVRVAGRIWRVKCKRTYVLLLCSSSRAHMAWFPRKTDWVMWCRLLMTEITAMSLHCSRMRIITVMETGRDGGQCLGKVIMGTVLMPHSDLNILALMSEQWATEWCGRLRTRWIPFIDCIIFVLHTIWAEFAARHRW